MRPLVTNHLTGLSLLVFLAALPVATGCASVPRPKILDESSTLLAPKNPEARELAQLRPKMLREAKHYLEQAEQAYSKGEYSRAKLLAHMARQRYLTAQNYVARDAAKRLAMIMETSRQEAADRQAELERYDQLEERLDKVTKDIESQGKTGKVNAEAMEAKKAILEARRKQADAIAAGAPTMAPEPYDKGKALVESAIDGLEMGMFSDTIKSSSRAMEAFEQAIDQAREAKAKQGSEQERKAAGASQPDESTARILAESAIADARAARTAAVTAGMPNDDPARFQLGTQNLDAAQDRFDRGDYPDALRLAKESANAFRGAGNVAGAANQARKAIREAEDARLDAMSRGASGDPAMTRADFALDMARRALQQRDFSRARDKAMDARRIYASMGGGKRTKTVNKAETMGRPGSLRRAAEDLVVQLKFQRAEMLGASKDKSCPAQFKQFEAILQLASDRLDHHDYVRGYQFAIRAQERIRTCVTTAATKPSADTAKQKAARTRAAKSLQRAQLKFAEAQQKLGEDDPRLKQPARLLASANQWYDRGDYDQADSLAKQVVKKLVGIRPRTKANQGRNGQPGSITKKQAADAIDKAQETYAQAVSKLGDDQRLKGPAKLIEAAQRWFDHEIYPRSKKMADKAIADLNKLLGRRGTKTAKPGKGKPGKKHAAPKPKATVSCQRVREDVLRNEKLAREVDDARLTPRQKRDFGDAKAFTSSASRLVQQKKCAEANDLSEQAFKMLFPLPRGKSTAKAATTKPKTAKANVQGKPWQDAYERSAEAVQRRKQALPLVQDATRATFAMGDASLKQAQLAYRSKQWKRAEVKAEQAISAFDAVITAAGQMPRQTNVETKTLPDDPVQRAQVVAQNYQAQAQTMPPGWKEGYSRVIEALSLRDRAKDAIGKNKSKDFDHGMQLISQARGAWRARNYVGAKALADQAIEAFQAAIQKAETVKDEPKVPEAKAPPKDVEDPHAFQLADEALRQARTTLAVCEREHCDDRDFPEFTAAKELLASAALSFEQHKYPYSEKLAQQATKKFQAVLAMPRKTKPEAPPKQDPAKAAQARTEAEDALREANVAVKLCAKKGCDRVDYESWLRADGLMSGARAAFADTNNERATKLAKEAEKLLRKILAQKPAFVMPDNVSGVTRSGDRLSVSPSIEFRRGSSVISPKSRASVQALATVLKANIDNLQSIKIIGHTDNTGNRKRNMQLSAARAASVMAALAQAGIPKELMSSEGKGPDEPIADNKTREGRAANRRVEVRIQLKPRSTSGATDSSTTSYLITFPARSLDLSATKEQRS